MTYDASRTAASRAASLAPSAVERLNAEAVRRSVALIRPRRPETA
ncbi:hypothetical protein ABXS69_00695 [Actinomyces timonensis]|uniref:Uncharacterized protein n=1 Tax=Actinomyces timonensis TaxID=1288391 RepID=A0AAU8N359_9ACTO